MSTVTEDEIAAAIATERFYVFPDTTVTVCCLTLRNGYHVIGMSACVDPANFSTAIGRSLARDHAREQIWSLEGYRLKQELFEQANANQVRVSSAATGQQHQGEHHD